MMTTIVGSPRATATWGCTARSPVVISSTALRLASVARCRAARGLRGSHDGSFDVSHALKDGKFWATAGQPVTTGETYDLVVVGGGISGLAAAYFYRARVPSARILILD